MRLLVLSRDGEIESILRDLLPDPAVRKQVIKGLADCGDASTPQRLLEIYGSLNEEERHEAVSTLSSRAAWASALLDGVEHGTVPRSDVPAFTARQIAGLHDERLTKQLEKTIGFSHSTPADKLKTIATLKQSLTPEALKSASPSKGRAVFSQTCAACHTLYDAGGNVGPNLTGSQRANLDYLLENIVDPNAIVAKDYQMTIVDTHDDRTLTGIIAADSPSGLTLRTPTGDVTIPVNEIARRKTSPLSLMPEGLLDGLKPDDRLNLISYLMSATPPPK